MDGQRAEDQRAAAAMFASNGTYVATATLAVIAVSLGLATYFLQADHRLLVFVGLLVVAVGCCVWSLLEGGRGVSDLAKRGSNGDWAIATRNQRFNSQALFALGGLVAAVLAVTVGGLVARGNTDGRTDALSRLDRTLQTRLASDATELARVEHELKVLVSKR